MNQAHLHLLLNHLPVVAAGIGFLLLGAAALRRSTELTKGAFCVLILAAVVAIPTYLTGGPAEEIVKSVAGVSQEAIEEHEDAAGIALAAIELLGIVCVAGLFILSRRSAAPSWLLATALILSLVAAALMARTANLGGRIHHAEVRAGEA